MLIAPCPPHNNRPVVFCKKKVCQRWGNALFVFVTFAEMKSVNEKRVLCKVKE